jgi:hypothetical protein
MPCKALYGVKLMRTARGIQGESTMTTNFERGSAKIYQFPVRARPALGVQREETKFNDRTVLNSASLRVANVGLGEAWYHEEAIREAVSKV